jgi:hypothetical protein
MVIFQMNPEIAYIMRHGAATEFCSRIEPGPYRSDGRTYDQMRFNCEQIIALLRKHQPRAKTGDLGRKHGNSEATL